MKYLIMLMVLFSLISCTNKEYSSDEIQNKKQEELSKQSVEAVGLPSINNFAEKKHLKEILELRDKDITTITYTRDISGKLHKICDSLGFGIPYATQYTSPEKLVYTYGTVHQIPQADPNGLFSPASADATWILCINPSTKRMVPVYVEDRITVSPFPLEQN
jgi:hypothetical protein